MPNSAVSTEPMLIYWTRRKDREWSTWSNFVWRMLRRNGITQLHFSYTPDELSLSEYRRYSRYIRL